MYPYSFSGFNSRDCPKSEDASSATVTNSSKAEFSSSISSELVPAYHSSHVMYYGVVTGKLNGIIGRFHGLIEILPIKGVKPSQMCPEMVLLREGFN